jgi:hypothetical protein
VDSERRNLERLAAQGDPDAAVAAIVARLRAGEVDEARVRLAALLGDPAARKLLGPLAPPVPANARELARALGASGAETLVRATLVAARAMAATADPRTWNLSRALAAMKAADDWLRCPCPEHVEAARRVAGEGDVDPSGSELAPAWVVIGPDGTRLLAAEWALACAASEIDDEPVRWALRRELVPWALGPSSVRPR